MSNLAIFDFNSNQVRVISIDGEPWFVAKDVCSVLEHSDVSMACQRLDDDEKLVQTLFVSGQNRDVVLVSESGLYSLVLTSRKPQAKEFKRWLTHEVIPSIRKTGSYANVPQTPIQQLAAQAANIAAQAAVLVEIESRQHHLEAEVEKQSHKIERLEAEVTRHDGMFTIRGYAAYKGLPLTLKEATRLGRLAAKMCAEHALDIDKVRDTRYGYVNAYPECILEVVFG